MKTIVCMLAFFALGCGKKTTPTTTTTPTGSTTCAAAADECCKDDGTIVKVSCGPQAGSDLQRRSDGTCEPCKVLLECLPAATLISTPAGNTRVDQLRAGMVVWTVDSAGRRIATPILRVQRVPVASGHRIARFTFSDHRVLHASPGHPALDGTPLRALHPGATYDGATVEEVELLSYEHDSTFDLLPAGETGAYWADGVLVGSTLR